MPLETSIDLFLLCQHIWCVCQTLQLKLKVFLLSCFGALYFSLCLRILVNPVLVCITLEFIMIMKRFVVKLVWGLFHTCSCYWVVTSVVEYHIVGNFRGRKLSRIGENTIFAEKTFAGCSLLQHQRCHAPNFVEKTFANSYKIAKFTKIFSLESFLVSSCVHLACSHSLAVHACL